MTPIQPFAFYFYAAFFSVPYSPHPERILFFNKDWGAIITTAANGGGWSTQYIVMLPSGVQINLATGEVKIPDNIKLDAASREFWLALAIEFPHVRDAWVVGYEAGKRQR